MRRRMSGSSLLRSVDTKATRRARRALELAHDEARRLHHDYLGTEHILLGLIDEGDGVAAEVLRQLAGRPEDVRSAVETMLAPGDAEGGDGEVGITPRAIRAMHLAEEEARSLDHHYLGTEHILLGLIDEGEGSAAGALRSLGIDADRAREAIIRVLTRMGSSEPAATRGHVITCRVDAQDLDAIDALVEAGVRSTRSDAAAWLIHAGIRSNRNILDRVYGTVAEIRRLREEVSQTLAAGETAQAEAGSRAVESAPADNSAAL
jgi:ATP-dependent Clp protease ATP-binding subunit ClpC